MQQQDARNWQGNKERKRRETGAEERKTKIAKATSRGRGWGRMASRKIPEKANHQQTTDEPRRIQATEEEKRKGRKEGRSREKQKTTDRLEEHRNKQR